MNAARDHSRFDELAVGSALYALEPGDEQALAEHLPTCSRCQQTLRDSQDSLAVLAAGLDGPMPPPRVLDRIHEAIGAPPSGPTPAEPVLPAVAEESVSAEHPTVHAAAPHAPAGGSDRDHTRPESAAGPQGRHRQGPGRGVRRSLRLRRLTESVAALVLVVALAVGALSYNHLRAQSQQRAEQAQQNQQTIQKLINDSSVATLKTTSGATVAHVVNQNGKLEVVSDGLSVNDATNSEYALWSLKGSSPTLVGTFDVKQGTNDVQSVASVPTGFGAVTGMAISKESGRGRPSKPSSVLASGVVTS